MDPVALTQVVVPGSWTKPAPYWAHGLPTTGWAFFGCGWAFFGTSLAAAMLGNNAVRRTTSVLINSLCTGGPEAERADASEP